MKKNQKKDLFNNEDPAWVCTMKEICAHLKISESTFKRKLRGEWSDFPSPIVISEKKKIWPKELVYGWMMMMAEKARRGEIPATIKNSRKRDQLTVPDAAD